MHLPVNEHRILQKESVLASEEVVELSPKLHQ